MKRLKANPLFKFFSSLKLAVFSILLLATVLAAATILESYYGMRAVHVLVYGTWWFAGVLALLGLNVLCAALSRYPWKKHQTGFAITHLGIIVILVGSFITQQFGVDGNLPVSESSQENEVILNRLELSVVDEKNGTALRFPVMESAHAEHGEWLKIDIGPDKSLVVDKYLPRALPNRGFVKSPVEGLGGPAIRLDLTNDRFHVSEWVFDQNPGEGAQLNLGPAVVRFKQLWSDEELKRFQSGKKEDAKPVSNDSPGYVVLKSLGREFRIEIPEALNKWTSVSGTDFELKIEKYLPYAVVENNDLVNRSQDPVNPAVQLFLRKRRDTAREPEKHTVFANFPEFTTLHRQKQIGNEALGANFKLVMREKSQEEMKFVGKNRGELRIAQTPDSQKLLYQVYSAAGELNSKGEVEVGKAVPTGWMNIEFKVTEWIPHAVEDESPRAIKYISGSGDNYASAVHVSVRDNKRGPAAQTPGMWLFEGAGRNISVFGKEYYVHFTKNQIILPFQIYLEKFTVGTNPGTTKAASYESDVIVRDPTNHVEKKAKISMNEPLVYGGYTFYQASYQLEEGRPPVSVFSVNRDEGRWIKYMGSLIMCLGIILMFYMNPHYWDILFKKKEEKVNHA